MPPVPPMTEHPFRPAWTSSWYERPPARGGVSSIGGDRIARESGGWCGERWVSVQGVNLAVGSVDRAVGGGCKRSGVQGVDKAVGGVRVVNRVVCRV